MRRAFGAAAKALVLVAFLTAFVVAFPERPGQSRPSQAAGPKQEQRHVAAYRCDASAAVPKGTPCRIAIERIGVDAPIIRLGLNRDGTLEVPTNFSQAGWWSGGTVPGKRGPAVIVGHVDSKSGPAVFYRLRELHPGDVVKVWRAGMPAVEFEVIASGRWPKAAFPTDLVYGELSYPGLRLVTCGGAFDGSTGHYVDNVIVFGRLAA